MYKGQKFGQICVSLFLSAYFKDCIARVLWDIGVGGVGTNRRKWDSPPVPAALEPPFLWLSTTTLRQPVIGQTYKEYTMKDLYLREVRQALAILSYGGHYKHAIPVGVEAVLRNDQQTLRQLVDAAHDDIGLVTALQKCTGKKLGYLLGEF